MKPSRNYPETSQETIGITWNQPVNNHILWNQSHHTNFLQGSETHMVEQFTEQRDSANQMYLFKVLRRQIVGIININKQRHADVFILNFKELSTLVLVFVVALWNLESVLKHYIKGTLIQSGNLLTCSSLHKNNMLKVSHNNTTYFLRCGSPRYVKFLFTNMQKQ